MPTTKVRALLCVGFLAACGGAESTVVSQKGTIELSTEFLSLAPGMSETITAQVTDADGSPIGGARVTWRTENGAVATVSTSGEVEAVGLGNTVVEAVYGEMSAAALVVVTTVNEPAFLSGSDALIDQEGFDGFDGVASGANQFRTKYGVGRTEAPSGNFGSITESAELNGLITLIAPGRGGAGKALRLNYGGAAGASDIIVGTEGQLGAIGGLDGTLPTVAAPYTHFFLTLWFRTSPGADPAAFDDSGVKGVMIFHNGAQRYEHNPTRLRYRFDRWPETRWNYVGGYPENAVTGKDHWKTPNGEPSHWSLYNDGNWHKLTREIYTTGDPSGLVGERCWEDGVLVFDNVGDILTGNDPTGQPWDVYRYNNPVTYWMVFGNYINANTALQSPNFQIYFDDWIAWTR